MQLCLITTYLSFVLSRGQIQRYILRIMKNFSSLFFTVGTIPSILCFLVLAATQTMSATPVETVAWNGHKGAVTFTFDDGVQSQITYLKPILDTLPGVKVTFNVSPAFYFGTNSSEFVQLAKAGHEVTNHTVTHKKLTDLYDSASIAAEVATEAKNLRALDPSIESVTFATPYCAANDLVDKVTNSESFITRGCGGTGLFTWGSAPWNWMRADSYYWNPSGGSNVSTATSNINTASSNNQWYVQLNHGVGGDWDIISQADINTLFHVAISANVWIDTYQRIGSYFRASFTMDTVQAQVNSEGFHMQWVSPHAKMPKSVKLRVTIDKSSVGSDAVVSQKGTEVAAETDGAYIIEFMDLELDVKQKSTGFQTRSIVFGRNIRAVNAGGTILLQGLNPDKYSYRICDLRGKIFQRGILDTGENSILLTAGFTGLAVIQVAPANSFTNTVTLTIPVK
jgi:peptidoglycan/xylan/chitin deacetylase (PgdA/CDA1 family)